MSRLVVCPVCEVALEPVLSLRDVPVITTALWPSAEGARTAPTGDLEIAICPACALIRNTAFDASLVEYDPSYENSQHFSATFERYARDLAGELSDRYSLAGGTVLEVGCGKGEFLALLCDVAGCRGVGFDPTYDGEVDDERADLQIIREPFGRDHITLDASLVCCRHVLEHIEGPVDFLSEVRASVADGTPVYFEVPDGEYVLTPGGLWDLIYPHVSYFTPPSLDLLFRRCGFEVSAVRSVFGGQYLSVEARAADPDPDATADAPAVRRIRTAAGKLSIVLEGTLGRWRDLLESNPDGDAVLWGAGAKGVSFLNLLSGASAIDRVVDVNPRKHGSYVPGTAQEVIAPATLSGTTVGRVLVMNPAYRDEIRQQLNNLELDPELLCI